MNELEMEQLRIRDEISWLQEAALTMRVKLDKQPDNLGPESDKTALRILARLEAIRNTRQTQGGESK